MYVFSFFLNNLFFVIYSLNFFALVFQFSQSYRLAILALVVFFLVGGLLLTRLDMRKGILEAGNVLPKVV